MKPFLLWKKGNHKLLYNRVLINSIDLEKIYQIPTKYQAFQ